MAMPKNLLLVRHDESEGNTANARSRAGDNSDFTEAFLKRHSSKFRLTNPDKRRPQAAGQWIMENVGTDFFRYYASEYLRAMETAGLLGLPGANWMLEFYLRERDWGIFDVMTDSQRQDEFASEIERRKIDSFFWTPPSGESLATLCRRIDRIIGTLHRECENKNVIIVCHGEVMLAFRVRLERMLQSRFQKLDQSRDPFNRIHNCQILHYSRVNPKTNEIEPYMNWMRSVCPWDMSLSSNEWTQIKRRTFSNEDLLEMVEEHPRLVEG